MSKSVLKPLWLTATLLAGCTAPTAPAPVASPPPVTPLPPTSTAPVTATRPVAVAPVDDTIASVGATTVSRADLQKSLIEAYGFNMLMLVVQREMAHDACAQAKIKVTPADVKWEYDWTLGQMFQNLDPSQDREQVLDQFLAQPKGPGQTTTRTELNVIIDTNAYLRKLVEPSISRAVTDEMLKQQFDETYGTQVQVRHIMTDNLQDAAAAAARLAAGDDFAAVARQVSRNPETRQQGGALPPFTINSSRFPENFKKVAFNLKPGEVSSPVQAGGGYHLIKLEKKIESKAMKFENVKADLREDYEAKLVGEAVKGVKARLAQQALAQMHITDPILKAEFDKRLAARDHMIRDNAKMKEQMERDRLKVAGATTVPTTGPATAPTSTPTVVPPPVATRPASSTAPTTAPATTSAPAPPPGTLPTPVAPKPVVPPPASSPRTTGPASAPVFPAPAASRDALSGKAIPASAEIIRSGVAPIQVYQGGGTFTVPANASTGVTPNLDPATRPTPRPALPLAASR